MTRIATPVRLLRGRDKSYFMDAVDEFESELQLVFPHVDVQDVHLLSFKRLAIRAFRRARSYLPSSLLRLAPHPTGGSVQLSVQMGPDFASVIPHFLQGGPNFIYMFDGWPRYMPWLVDFVDYFNVRTIFFSARDSCRLFNERKGQLGNRGRWLPEGIAPDGYHFAPPEEKQIDVLEFGRRFESYHHQIQPVLAQANKNHVYGKNDALLFAKKGDLCQALAQSKICVCFPSSMTHPARAEGISTMTLRYLQAMLSKCLVVGIPPSDIVEVIGYDPVVSYDPEDPGGQLLALLNDWDRHQELIERNYSAVTTRHLWRHRLQSIRPFLCEAG